MNEQTKRSVQSGIRNIANISTISPTTTTTTLLLLLGHLIALVDWSLSAEATSINYGISQQTITDISQLMPRLCQNQTVICEGSFCIPGVRKCVCDLRMPVQVARFCLRQVDIDTKCFVTNQCNHTIKDAVCLDINSQQVIDLELGKRRLENWQQLKELKSQLSEAPDGQRTTTTTTRRPGNQRSVFLIDSSSMFSELGFEARDDVMPSNVRNSPYEINYNTPELLQQNHTRRRTNHSDRPFDPFKPPLPDSDPSLNELQNDSRPIVRDSSVETSSASASSSESSISPADASRTDPAAVRSASSDLSTTTPAALTSTKTSSTVTTTSTSTPTSSAAATGSAHLEAPRKAKPASWPPGICSCPPGFMFDCMLRKCLALSLADSHCQSDNDCKQIALTHCSRDSKKCECDEPLVWEQKACARPRQQQQQQQQEPAKGSPEVPQAAEGLAGHLIALLLRLLSDQTMLLLIFVVIVILATLVILYLTVNCFSSTGSALISPKRASKSKQTTPTTGASSSSGLPPRSPYATLKRPDSYKPSTELSKFAQATRGRILNYDFEQDTQDESNSSQAAGRAAEPAAGKAGEPTLVRQKGHKHQSSGSKQFAAEPAAGSLRKSSDCEPEQMLELNDNLSQLESETKSDNSILTIPPGPPASQPPPYMLPSAMKGQGSAIAAAAAAVANRRMAKKKNADQSQVGLANGSPVFL